MALNHHWVKSQLGHGETMCERCLMTNREAAVLGLMNECSVAPAAAVKLQRRPESVTAVEVLEWMRKRPATGADSWTEHEIAVEEAITDICGEAKVRDSSRRS